MTDESDQGLDLTSSEGDNGVQSSRGFVRSPVPNMDLPTFRNFLARALGGDLSVPPSILTGMRGVSAEDSADRENRTASWWENYFWFQALQENLRSLRELIETKRVERDQIVEDIRSAERQLTLYARHKDGYARAKSYRDLHGAYELNKSGELADTDAEDMLSSWEKRKGKKVDRESLSEIQNALDDQRQYEDSESLRIEEQLSLDRQRIEELDDEINDLESAEQKARTELGNGGDPRVIESDLQRELIAKGHGTEEQKRQLAEAQGIDLVTIRNIAQAADDFDGDEGLSLVPNFNETANPAVSSVDDAPKDEVDAGKRYYPSINPKV